MENLVERKKEIGLYIHIPFCIQKCKYCAFLSSSSFDDELLSRYVKRVAEEIRSYKTKLNGRVIKYVFIGGGTPNTLSIGQLAVIFNEISETAEEISIELNPGLKDIEYLHGLKKLGINRVSIGVQSFSDETLKRIGRVHSSTEARNFISDVKKAGFGNFNIDLIIGLPNQSLEEVLSDVKTAKAFAPTHISAYLLSIDEGTAFHHNKDQILREIPNELELLRIFYSTQKLLENSGYRRYEISNYAKPGSECEYNLNTWQNGEYIGVGLGAESHFDGERYANTVDMQKYLSGSDVPTSEKQVLTTISDFESAVILGLRLRNGVDLSEHLEALPGDYVSLLNERIGFLVESDLVAFENGTLKMVASESLILDYILERLLV